MQRMLINASNSGQIRIALARENKLYDLEIFDIASQELRGNIYSGRVHSINNSLGAAFIDIGEDDNAFLPFSEVNQENMLPMPPVSVEAGTDGGLKRGQELLVQVKKDSIGDKGPAVTMAPGFTSSLLALYPNGSNRRNISQRIQGRNARMQAREKIDGLVVPENVDVVLRSMGSRSTLEQLQQEADVLLRLYQQIRETAQQVRAPVLIYRDDDVIASALQNYSAQGIEEIIVDTEETYEHVSKTVGMLQLDFADRVHLHDLSQGGLFTFYKVENQSRTAFQRSVKLPSGGELVFDQTEALLAIDVNSARSKSGSNINETALNTNVEAAAEIARQLRLRDTGGLIVIDFIDMETDENRHRVENVFSEAIKQDRARTHLGAISEFGLMEISRQRMHLHLMEKLGESCPHCAGQGWMRTISTMSLAVLRSIEEEACKGATIQVWVTASPEVATLMLNDKRDALNDLESLHDIQIVVIADKNTQRSDYWVEGLGESDERLQMRGEARLPQTPPQSKGTYAPHKVRVREALIDGKGEQERKKRRGLWHWLFDSDSKKDRSFDAAPNRQKASGHQQPQKPQQRNNRKRPGRQQSGKRQQDARRGEQQNNQSQQREPRRTKEDDRRREPRSHDRDGNRAQRPDADRRDDRPERREPRSHDRDGNRAQRPDADRRDDRPERREPRSRDRDGNRAQRPDADRRDDRPERREPRSRDQDGNSAQRPDSNRRDDRPERREPRSRDQDGNRAQRPDSNQRDDRPERREPRSYDRDGNRAQRPESERRDGRSEPGLDYRDGDRSRQSVPENGDSQQSAVPRRRPKSVGTAAMEPRPRPEMPTPAQASDHPEPSPQPLASQPTAPSAKPEQQKASKPQRPQGSILNDPRRHRDTKSDSQPPDNGAD